MIIAIDGPAGSGKSTVAKRIAQELGLLYIDTGAMYRALTLAAINKGLSGKDQAGIIDLAASCEIALASAQDGDGLKVVLDGADVTRQIRDRAVNEMVSDVAQIKQVREIMVSRQQELGRQGDAVLEGRDITTVVFPDADYKFFLDAGVRERAKRRYKEIEGAQDVSLSEIEANIRRRDKIDSQRDTGPLKRAKDAIYIDTTDMGVEAVVRRMVKEIKTGDIRPGAGGRKRSQGPYR
ncbi:MAG: (d)CMP kinase [Candidatus Omnitrophota bacterium]